MSFLFFQFYSRRVLTNAAEQPPVLKIMSYSNFLKNWGPGPEIVAEFEKKNAIKIQWVDVGNSGMILQNLQGSVYLPDVVVGIDFLSLPEARSITSWKPLAVSTQGINDLPRDMIFKDFVPMDWSPMTFIFRRSQISTPHSLKDLLKKEYANSLAIQDPTTSTSGVYFLIWILSVYGEEEGFKYLKDLKSSIRLVAPSWSAAYSLFQNNQVPMVFSFFTSTIYHYVNEGDYQYQPVYFDEPHIYSVEYVGVPEQCNQCGLAQKFVEFLLTKESQKKIMDKNFMLPVISQVKAKTPFDFPKSIQLISPDKYKNFVEQKKQLLEKWQELNL